MKTLDLIQGTPEWLAARTEYFTASEAPAMLGLSKYKSRDALLREKATGLVEEVDEATQRRFDAGHAAEAATREWAEQEVGEDLYPVTGAIEIDGMKLLASFDGLTLEENIVWENKSFNSGFAAQVESGIIPDTHFPQLEQQLLVSGAEKALFTVSDGDLVAHIWYTSQPDRRAQLIAGWKQFAEDLANYQHVEVIPATVATPQMSLPAVTIRVDGSIALVDNLSVFGDALTAYLERINKKPETDQDFADLEATVKTLRRAEDELDAAENNALGQAASIDTMRKTVAMYRAMTRDNRLFIDKLVKAEKENRKAEIITKARKSIDDHVSALNNRIGGNWMPQASSAPFAEAIKGLKSIDSMRDKVNTALANAKIEANEIADRIQANHEHMSIVSPGYDIAPDFAQICMKQEDDFAALLAMRINQRNEREAARLEADRTRIRAEEQAKADRAATLKAQAEQDARDAETARQRALEQERMQKERAELIANQEAAIREALEVDRAAHRAARAAEELANTQSKAPKLAAAVIEHQDEIAAFMATRDFGKESHKIRAVLVEFVKFQSLRMK